MPVVRELMAFQPALIRGLYGYDTEQIWWEQPTPSSITVGARLTGCSSSSSCCGILARRIGARTGCSAIIKLRKASVQTVR